MYPYPEYPLLWLKGFVDVQLFGAVYLLLQRAADWPWRESVVTAGKVVVMVGWLVPLILALSLWAFTFPVALFERLKRISTAAMILTFLSMLLLPVLGVAFTMSLLVSAALGWHQAITFIVVLLLAGAISLVGTFSIQALIHVAATRHHNHAVRTRRESAGTHD